MWRVESKRDCGWQRPESVIGSIENQMLRGAEEGSARWGGGKRVGGWGMMGTSLFRVQWIHRGSREQSRTH